MRAMKKSKMMRAAALAGLMLAASMPAAFPVWADDGDGDRRAASFGPRATYNQPKDADDGEWYGGAQLRLYFSEVLGLEGSIDYRRNDFGDTEIDVYPVQASLLAYLMPGTISPFLLGGAGWYYTHVEGPGGFDETDSRFGFHAGGGVQLYLNEYWSFDSTYRYIWLEEVASRDDDNNVLERDYDDSGHMVTIGLNLHF
jgi:opacity protein-like surface antigen